VGVEDFRTGTVTGAPGAVGIAPGAFATVTLQTAIAEPPLARETFAAS
jgi:hypothetical protein